MKAVMQTLPTIALILLPLLGLGGCGQRGDLTLPAEPVPVSEPASQQPAASPAPSQQPVKDQDASPGAVPATPSIKR